MPALKYNCVYLQGCKDLQTLSKSLGHPSCYSPAVRARLFPILCAPIAALSQPLRSSSRPRQPATSPLPPQPPLQRPCHSTMGSRPAASPSRPTQSPSRAARHYAAIVAHVSCGSAKVARDIWRRVVSGVRAARAPNRLCPVTTSRGIVGNPGSLWRPPRRQSFIVAVAAQMSVICLGASVSPGFWRCVGVRVLVVQLQVIGQNAVGRQGPL